jgi:hypothetical protein
MNDPKTCDGCGCELDDGYLSDYCEDCEYAAFEEDEEEEE